MGEPMPCAIPLDEVADPCPFPGVVTRDHSTASQGDRVVVVALRSDLDGWPGDGMVRVSARCGRMHWTLPADAVAVDVSRPGGQQLVGRWLANEATPVVGPEEEEGVTRLVMRVLCGDLDTGGQRDLCALVARVLEARRG